MSLVVHLVPVLGFGLITWAVWQQTRTPSAQRVLSRPAVLASALWFSGAAFATWASYRTNLRSMRCGEYNFSTFSAEESWIFIVPCLLWFVVSLATWRVSVTRFASIASLCAWLLATGGSAIANEVTSYLACDREGDEVGQGLAFAGVFLVPVVWISASLLAVAWLSAYKAVVKARATPNPSIERTSPGKPGAASHVKR